MSNHEKSKKHRDLVKRLESEIVDAENNEFEGNIQKDSISEHSEFDFIDLNKTKNSDNMGISYIPDKDESIDSGEIETFIDPFTNQMQAKVTLDDVNPALKFQIPIHVDDQDSIDIVSNPNLIESSFKLKDKIEHDIIDSLESFSIETKESDLNSNPTIKPKKRRRAQKQPLGKTSHQNLEQKGNISQPSSNSDLICTVCSTTFTSRNKLFQHIKIAGHAIRITPIQENINSKLKSSKSNRKK